MGFGGYDVEEKVGFMVPIDKRRCRYASADNSPNISHLELHNIGPMGGIQHARNTRIPASYTVQKIGCTLLYISNIRMNIRVRIREKSHWYILRIEPISHCVFFEYPKLYHV